MIANKCFLIGLHLLVTYHVAKTFVILSANVEDVKRIAKEFSGPLTDEIVGLILKATKNHTFKTSSHEIKAQNHKYINNSPEKLKNKKILKDHDRSIQSANYEIKEKQVKDITNYSNFISPKIHYFAKVKTEDQRTYNTPKIHVMSLNNHITPPPVPRDSDKILNEPKKYDDDQVPPKVPIILSKTISEPSKYQNKHLSHMTPPQISKVPNKILSKSKNYYNDDQNHIELPEVPKKILKAQKKYGHVDRNRVVLRKISKASSKKVNKAKKNTDDLNKISTEEDTVKKRDTSTKIIEFNSNSEEETNFHHYEPSSKKRKEYLKTMQTIEITNKEKTTTTLEAKVSIKKKTKKYKTVQKTVPTEETTHNDETTVDIELKNFENEVRSYLTSKLYPKPTSEISQTQNEQSTDSHFESNIKQIHSENKSNKTQTKRNEITEVTTLKQVKLAEKVNQLDQLAQNFMNTSRKNLSTRPTPAYPKKDYNEYKIPSSEYKLSYDPNQKANLEDYSQMYASFYERNETNNESPENQLSGVIQKIIETRLNKKLSKTNEYSSRRQHISRRPTEVHNTQGVLTNSEEETISKIIKAMIDNRKIKEIKSPRYAKENKHEIEKRYTIKAFNIQNLSPEEKMADVVHKIVDSSLRMPFEKPHMPASALAEILKNKYYNNDKASSNEKKVSEMIEKLIEKKIQEFVQITTNTLDSKQFHAETRPNPYSKDKRWPNIRPSYKNARAQSTRQNESPASTYETLARSTEVEKIPKVDFLIPYAEYDRTSSTMTTKRTDESPVRKKQSTKRHHNQHTSTLSAQDTEIKISHGRQGPISIVIEDRESDEIKRPLPQALLLQKPQITHRTDPQIIVVDNRHIQHASTKSSYWQEDIKTKLIKKNLREEKITKPTDIMTTKHNGSRSNDEIQANESDSYNKIPNVQIVFLSVPQLESKKNIKQNMSIKKKKRKEEKKKEGDKIIEKEGDKKGEQEEEKRQEEQNKEEKGQKDNRIAEENREEKQKIIEEGRTREKEMKIQEERKQREQKRTEEEKKQERENRKEKKRTEEEKRLEEKRIEDESKLKEIKRIEEQKRRDKEKKKEEKRIEEEKRQEVRKHDEKRIEKESKQEERKRKEEKKQEEEKRIEKVKKQTEERMREEEKITEEERRREERKRTEGEKRREIEKKKEEKRLEEEKRKKEERRQEELKRKEGEVRQEEEKIKEERRREEQKKKEEKRLEEEKIRVVEQKIREKIREEENRLQEKIQEEKRKNEIREESENKALRQKIIKEIKEKEIFDQESEKKLENKNKEKQKADAIAAMQEAENKRKEAEKELVKEKLFLMQEQFKKYLKKALQHTHNNKVKTTNTTTQRSTSTTLNYWEQQWQQDQEVKLREEYNKYIHDTSTGLGDKKINYWNDQWRTELEKKLREKQIHEKTKTTPNNNWFSTEQPTTLYNLEEEGTLKETASMELVSNQPVYVSITDVFGNIVDSEENIQTEPSNPFVHNWPRKKLRQTLKSNEKYIPKKIVIRAYPINKPNSFDTRRDDDSDTIYIMPDIRKRDNVIMKRTQDRSRKGMSDEQTDKKKDVIESDTVIVEEKNDRRKSKRSQSKKVSVIRDESKEQMKKNTYVDKTSETMRSDNEEELENYKSKSGEIKKSYENILRERTNSIRKSKHKKIKRDNSEPKVEYDEYDDEEKVQKKKINENKEDEHKKLKKSKKNNKIYDTKVKKRINQKKLNEKNENSKIILEGSEKFKINRSEKNKGQQKRKLRKNLKAENQDITEKEHNKQKTQHRNGNNITAKKDENHEDELDKKQRDPEKEFRKTKHRKGIKDNSQDDEQDPEHKKREKNVQKSKQKKEGKDMVLMDKTVEEKKLKYTNDEKDVETHTESIEEVTVDKKKERKRNHKRSRSGKYRENLKIRDDDDKFNEEIFVGKKEEKNGKHIKRTRAKGRAKLNLQMEEKEKIKTNKNDENSDGNEFDFQLMIGEKT